MSESTRDASASRPVPRYGASVATIPAGLAADVRERRKGAPGTTSVRRDASSIDSRAPSSSILRYAHRLHEIAQDLRLVELRLGRGDQTTAREEADGRAEPALELRGQHRVDVPERQHRAPRPSRCPARSPGRAHTPTATCRGAGELHRRSRAVITDGSSVMSRSASRLAPRSCPIAETTTTPSTDAGVESVRNPDRLSKRAFTSSEPAALCAASDRRRPSSSRDTRRSSWSVCSNSCRFSCTKRLRPARPRKTVGSSDTTREAADHALPEPDAGHLQSRGHRVARHRPAGGGQHEKQSRDEDQRHQHRPPEQPDERGRSRPARCRT